MYKNNSKKNSQKPGKGSGLSQSRGGKRDGMQFALSKASKLINSKVVKDNLGTVRMSSCAAKLAASIADPFSEEAKGACFPMYPAPDSHKVSAFSRFDGAIGTKGIGWIALNPSIANDAPSGYFTNAVFTGTGIFPLSANNTLSTGVETFMHNGPYSYTELIPNGEVSGSGPFLSGRVVTTGVRVTYTGTTLNESGTISLLAHPTHGNASGIGVSKLQMFSQTNICPFTKKPCGLTIAPMNAEETSYPLINEATETRLLYPFGSDTRFFNSGLLTTAVTNTINVGEAYEFVAAAPIAAIMVTGVAGMTFHVDVIQHLEYAGRGAASAATPNSVDVSSVQAILTAASQLSTRKMAHPNQSPWKLLMDGIRSAMGSPVGLTARGIVRI